MSLERPLVLLGMMGSGKSSVARWIAEREGAEVCELDATVSAAAGKDIPTIFAEDGEESFRDLETAALGEALARGGPVIIDTGGGVVESETNCEMLLGSDTDRCYIEAAVSLLASRITETASRPKIDVVAPEDRLAALSVRRKGLYKKTSTFTVRSEEGEEVGDTALKVLEGIRK